MVARGYAAPDTGRVRYDAVLARAREPRPRIPPTAWLSREALMDRRRQRASRSQQRHYSEDYVYEFVEGDGQTFDFGYDFYECAATETAGDRSRFGPPLPFDLCQTYVIMESVASIKVPNPP